jgi:hypothetical protein
MPMFKNSLFYQISIEILATLHVAGVVNEFCDVTQVFHQHCWIALYQLNYLLTKDPEI